MYQHLIERIKGENVSIKAELEALNAPRTILDAGEECQKHIDAKLRPPQGLVSYIERWVGRQREQNRYGK